MMIDSEQDGIFEEANSSTVPKLLGAAAALLITALVFGGYTLLRKRHAQTTAALVPPATSVANREPPKVLIIVDEALLKGGNSLLAGTVKNTSSEKLEGLSVELELKRRQDGGLQSQLIPLEPSELEPQGEGRYSLQLKAQDYSSARLVGLKAGPKQVALPFATAQGQKRPLERLETKTVIIGKPGSKGGEFLNSPDNPARVP
jgi:hypothetical protein